MCGLETGRLEVETIWISEWPDERMDWGVKDAVSGFVDVDVSVDVEETPRDEGDSHGLHGGCSRT